MPGHNHARACRHQHQGWRLQTGGVWKGIKHFIGVLSRANSRCSPQVEKQRGKAVLEVGFIPTCAIAEAQCNITKGNLSVEWHLWTTADDSVRAQMDTQPSAELQH